MVVKTVPAAPSVFPPAARAAEGGPSGWPPAGRQAGTPLGGGSEGGLPPSE